MNIKLPKAEESREESVFLGTIKFQPNPSTVSSTRGSDSQEAIISEMKGAVESGAFVDEQICEKDPEDAGKSN